MILLSGFYDYELLEALNRIANGIDSLAASLEKLSAASEQDRKEIGVVGMEESAERRKRLADAVRGILAEQISEE